MLTELYIENFALIDRMTVSFASGLTVLTGETGTGKSIVIDAINVLLGERAGTELVRTGAERAVLQGVFEVAAGFASDALLELGIEPEDGQLIIAREVAREGRNVARVNGRICPVAVVRQLGDLLVDLHGQHEHQSLLKESQHLAFLDALGDAAYGQLRARVAELAHTRGRLLAELRALETGERDRLRNIDLLSFQLEEIARAELVEGEEESLNTERTRLANAERLHGAADATYRLLYEAEEGASVLDALARAESELSALIRIDPSVEPIASALESALVQVQEAAHDVAAYRDTVQADPERLTEIEERRALLQGLLRKYGESVAAVLAYAAEKTQELRALQSAGERGDEAQAALNRTEAALAVAAEELSVARRHVAEELAPAVQDVLAHLGMEKAVFAVSLTRTAREDGLLCGETRVAVSADGVDDVAFLISANPGEPPKALAKTASGGELSRVMLALKAVAAAGSGVPTLIFDEIDTGIGGRTAEAVGSTLARVARGAQVICVTHLAQLAVYADRHYALEKTTEGERTVSRAREVAGEARVEEIARLQAGGRVTDAIRQHVRDALADAARPTGG
jgi:DNA repair protein RecN (Recombination protein N)